MSERVCYVLFEQSLCEIGLTWEDVKENIPPCVNVIGIAAQTPSERNGSSFPSVTAFAMWICRKFGLLRNDKTLFASSEDVVNSIVIALTKEQESNDLEVSDVLDLLRLIRKTKQEKGFEAADEMHRNLVKGYCSRLKSSNIVDAYDLVRILTDRLDDEESPVFSYLRNYMSNEDDGGATLVVFKQCDRSSSEADLLELFLRKSESSVKLLSLETSLDSSVAPEGRTKFNVAIDDVDLDSNLFENGSSTGCTDTDASESGSERYCTQWADGFLRLLVNSRDELALSRIICGPFGVLDKSAFAIMRKEAAKTGMPVYQTLVSYVNKLKLGGKSYAPTSDHALYPYNKELTEFLDLTDKLQERLEEEKTEEASSKKILGTLRSHVLRSGMMKTVAVEKSFQRLGLICNWASMTEGSKVGSTPKRACGAGGSMAGRKNMKVTESTTNILATYPRNSIYRVSQRSLTHCMNIGTLQWCCGVLFLYVL
jgi:hypothetical protein